MASFTYHPIPMSNVVSIDELNNAVDQLVVDHDYMKTMLLRECDGLDVCYLRDIKDSRNVIKGLVSKTLSGDTAELSSAAKRRINTIHKYTCHITKKLAELHDDLLKLMTDFHVDELNESNELAVESNKSASGSDHDNAVAIQLESLLQYFQELEDVNEPLDDTDKDKAM